MGLPGACRRPGSGADEFVTLWHGQWAKCGRSRNRSCLCPKLKPVVTTLANALIYGILATKKQDRLAFHLCLRRRYHENPKMGIIEAIVAPLFACAIFPDLTGMGFHSILQIAILFVLLHSLRWNDSEQAGTASARNFAALLWFGNSLWWIISNSLVGGWGTLFPAPLLSWFILPRV